MGAIEFQFKGKKGPCQTVCGTVNAIDQQSAVTQILNLGISPLEISPARNTKHKTNLITLILKSNFEKVTQNDTLLFTQQLSDLIESRVPMLQALKICAKQCKKEKFRKILIDISTQIQGGQMLSETLQQHPRIFSTLYVQMVMVGESSGNLPKTLCQLTDYLETRKQTRQKIVQSLAYPALILITGILTVFVLMNIVIPQLAVLFDDLNQKLPWPTMLLLWASHVCKNYMWIFLIIIFTAFVYTRKAFKSYSKKLKIDQWIISAPVLGRFIQVTEASFFTQTLSVLLGGGLAMNKALKISAHSASNLAVKEELRMVSNRVSSGESLHSSIARSKIIPNVVSQIVAVGEESGHLTESLNKASNTLNRESNQSLKLFMTILGPAVLICIVSIVGFFVMSMLLPILALDLSM